jgi:hypothetical protein
MILFFLVIFFSGLFWSFLRYVSKCSRPSSYACLSELDPLILLKNVFKSFLGGIKLFLLGPEFLPFQRNLYFCVLCGIFGLEVYKIVDGFIKKKLREKDIFR